MNQHQSQVKEFMIAAGQGTPPRIAALTKEVADLRVRLIQEELTELRDAKDFVEVADAIGDLLYVVYGAAVAYGIDIEPIFAEIHRSNMSKFIDGHRREDGKWVKGPSYSPANLAPLVNAQM